LRAPRKQGFYFHQKNLIISEQHWEVEFSVRNYKANNPDEILKITSYFSNFFVSYMFCYIAA